MAYWCGLVHFSASVCRVSVYSKAVFTCSHKAGVGVVEVISVTVTDVNVAFVYRGSANITST